MSKLRLTVSRPGRRIALGLTLCLASSLAPAQPTPASAERELPAVEATATRVRPGANADEVTTATRTDTPLRDLPASVVVVPRQTLREQGVIDMNQALTNVSGVQPVMGGGYGFANNYTIRGLPMRWLRDGLPDGPAQNGYWRTLADVERIEVLKGPGSALYGSGNPGGTVNLITRAPLARLDAEASAYAGSFGLRGATVDVGGGPAGGRVATRLVANHEQLDGFRGLGRRINEVLPSVAVALTDRQLLTLDLDWRDIRVTPDNYGIVFDRNGRLPAVSREARYYSPFNFADQRIRRATVGHEWRVSEQLVWRTALVDEQRDLDMVRNAGANAGNAAGQVTGRTARAQRDDAAYRLLRTELLWAGQAAGLAHTLLAGAEYADTNIDATRVGYNLPPIASLADPRVPETSLAGLAPVAAQGFDRRIEARNPAVFVQDQIALGPQVKLRAGLRHDWLRFSDVGTQGAGAQGAPAFRDISERRSFTTGNLGAVWQPDQAWSLFAGVASGRFVNLGTEAAAVPRAPEGARQYEVGVKATLLQQRADVQLAVYQNERSNYLITLPGALSPVPEGRDRTRGVELDLIARPARGWSMLANAYLQDPEVLSNTLASNPTLGVTNRSIAGTRPAGVARHGARLWATYGFDGALAGLTAGAGVTYKGDSFADNLNLHRVPSYTVLDAALLYRTRAWDLGLNLVNLTDRRYYVNPTFVGALPGAPRSVLVTARVRFL